MTWKKELESYVGWLQGRAEPVSESYANSVQSSAKRLGERFEPESFLDLTREDLLTWVKELRQEGLSEASIKVYNAQVKAMARFLSDDGEVPKAYKGGVGGRKKHYSRVKSRSDLLTDRELEALIANLSPRDAMAALLIRFTGARPGEVLGLRRRDVEFVTKEGRTFVLLSFADTKTGGHRSAALAEPATIGALQRYLEYHQGGDYLFRAPRKGGALDYQPFWKAVNGAAKRAGIEKRVYPYLLRHTFATREGMRMGSAARARQMGTQSETVLAHYDHVSGEDLVDLLAGMEGTGKPVMGPQAAAFTELVGMVVEQNRRMMEALGTLLPLEDLKRMMPPEEKDRMAELVVAITGEPPRPALPSGE